MAKDYTCFNCKTNWTDNDPKVCPKCGTTEIGEGFSKQDKPKESILKKKVPGWVLFIILAIVAVILYFRFKSPESNKPIMPQEPVLILVKAFNDNSEYSRYIGGIVSNNSGKTLGYVQITFNLFDGDNNQVGTAFDNMNSLKPYGTWRFRALIPNDMARKWEFDNLSGH